MKKPELTDKEQKEYDRITQEFARLDRQGGHIDLQMENIRLEKAYQDGKCFVANCNKIGEYELDTETDPDPRFPSGLLLCETHYKLHMGPSE